MSDAARAGSNATSADILALAVAGIQQFNRARLQATAYGFWAARQEVVGRVTLFEDLTSFLTVRAMLPWEQREGRKHKARTQTSSPKAPGA